MTPASARPVVGRAPTEKGVPMSTSTVSSQKRRANRLNAKKSTGPRTVAGKARSARNATSHGLYCAALVLPGESHELFHNLRQSYISTLKPQNLVELLIVDRLVAAAWKLRRLQEAEALMHDGCMDDLLAQRAEVAENLLDELGSGDPRAAEVAAEVEQMRLPAAAVLAMKLQSPDLAFERLQRYEQRLDYTISRCLRELRKLRDDAEAREDLPVSPFLRTGVPPVSQEREQEREQDTGETPVLRETQNEATADHVAASAGVAEDNDAAVIESSAANARRGHAGR